MYFEDILMLNNVYKLNTIKEAVFNNKHTNPNEHCRTVKADLDINIVYSANKDLSKYKTARGIWVTANKLCFQLKSEDKLIIDETLFLKFIIPSNNIVTYLEVTLDQQIGDRVVVNHGACTKNCQDKSANNLVEYLAEASWKQAFETYHQTNNINTFIAKDYSQFNEATKLLYREYRIKGYCTKMPFTSYFNYFAILPGSKTFLIQNNENLLGTFSFIPDSPHGLPSESIYSKEISYLRSKKRKFAELSLLAFDAEKIEGRKNYLLTDPFKMFLFVKLVKACIDHAYQTGVTDLLVATNPIHKRNYQFLLFEKMGRLKTYKDACDNPAILLHADLSKIRNKLNSLENKATNSLINYLYTYTDSKDQKLDNSIALLLERSCSHIPVEVSDYIQFCYRRH